MSINLQAEPIDACILVLAPQATMSQKLKPVKSAAGLMSSTDHHPLSPLPRVPDAASLCDLVEADTEPQTEGYFDLKVDVGEDENVPPVTGAKSSETQPAASSSNGKTTADHQPHEQQSSLSPSTSSRSLTQPVPGLIQKTSLTSAATTLPSRMRLVRDDTIRQILPEMGRSNKSAQLGSQPVQSSSNSLTTCPPGPSVPMENTTKSSHLHQNPQKSRGAFKDWEPKRPSSSKLKVSLSNRPHLITSDDQLLQELRQNLNSRDVFDSSSSQAHELQQVALNQILLGLIRELSSKLQSLQSECNTARQEAGALKLLLTDGYSVGPGEIERCLVRSRSTNDSSNESGSQPQPSDLRWDVEISNWDRYQGSQPNSAGLSTKSRTGSSGSPKKLDLEDLREAMSDNPCFDAASQSSCRSRSLVTSPGSINSHHPTSPSRFQNHDINRSGSSSIRFFNPASIISSRYRKSNPGQPLIPPGLPPARDHPTLPTSPDRSMEHSHKRNTSTGSNLSASSSQHTGTGFRNGNWGFYGWKWHKRSKPPGSLAPSVAGDMDSEEHLDCDEDRNDVSEPEVNSGSLPEGANWNDDHLNQSDRDSNRPRTNTGSADTFTPLPIQSGSVDGPGGGALLTGLLDSITRKKRTGSTHAKSRPPAIPNTLLTSNLVVSAQSSGQPHGSPGSMNITSSLITNRSSSLLLGSSCSATTETTSANSTSSVEDSCLTQQSHPSAYAPSSEDSHTADPTSLLPASNLLEIDSLPRTTPLDTPNRSSTASSAISSSANSLLLPPPCLASVETHASLEEMEELISTACGAAKDHTSSLPQPPFEMSSPNLTTTAPGGPSSTWSSESISGAQNSNQELSAPQSRRASSTNSKSPAHMILSSSKCLPSVATQAELVAQTETSLKQLPHPRDSNSHETSPLVSPGRELGKSRSIEETIFMADERLPLSRKASEQFILSAELKKAFEQQQKKSRSALQSSKGSMKSAASQYSDNSHAGALPSNTKTKSLSSFLAAKSGRLPDDSTDSRQPSQGLTSAKSPTQGSSKFSLPRLSSSGKAQNSPAKLTRHASIKSPASTAQASLGMAIGLEDSSVGQPHNGNLEPNLTTLPTTAFGRTSSISSVAPITPTASLIPSKTSVTNVTASTLLFSGSLRGNPKPCDSLSSSLESSGSVTQRQNNLQSARLNQLFLPQLSNSTMELSTFTSPQSNPPPFSLIGHDDEGRSTGFSSGLPSRTSEQGPVTDRFGFIVDVKYGLKLMRESRDRKKRLMLQRDASSTMSSSSIHQEQHSNNSPGINTDNLPADSASVLSPGSTDLKSSEDNSSNHSIPNECGSEALEMDQPPIMTTALPIKSQVDVEAELASLRESLGLPPAADDSSKSKEASRNSNMDQNSQIGGDSEHESPKGDDATTQSIKRLLSQLNDMQNIMEQSRMRAWSQFIAKRKSRLVKTPSAATSSHLGTSTTASSTASFANSSETQGSKKNPGNGNVSPSSVGAFLALGRSASSSGNNLNELPANISSSKAPGHQILAGQHSPNSLDLITCHDDNLIGIASMGLSSDNGKIALRDDWKEFRNLVKKGVPISLRPKIWLECSGASELKEPGYYDDLLNLHKDEGSMCLNQIECDVTRTLPTNIYFGGDGPGVSKLRRVLAAMSWHNPRVGYCQGMNMVAATLLLTIPSEEDAFWVLACIVDKILPPDYYTSHLLTSQADQRVLRDLVEKHLPELWSHFDSLEVELPAITFGWFLSLFADALPIQTLLRVFDLFLIDGSLLLFRVSLALLKINRSAILSQDSPASLYAYMRGPMTLTSHHSDKIIEVATESFKEVKNKLIFSLREKHVEDLKAEMGIK